MTDDTSATEPREAKAAFTADLRALRITAGNPTLQALASKTGISKSVISEAFTGTRLPTENTLTLLTAALGADPRPWVERRSALDPRIVSAGDPRSRGGGDQRPAAPRMVRRRSATLVAVASAVAAGAIASAVWAAVMATMPPVAAPNELPFETGVDPMVTACRNDAVLAASEPRLDERYTVEMMYSNDCMAVWGRVTRFDELASGNEIGIRIYPMGDPESDRAQETVETGLQSVYTPMLVEPDVSARVCGIAWVTIDGETVDLGPELCI